MKLKLGSNIKHIADLQFCRSDVAVCLFLVKNIKSTSCQASVEMLNPSARSEFWGVASRVPSLQATLPPPDIFGNFR